jgi:chemotaxis protein CheC
VSTPLALALPLTEAIDYAASEPRSGAIVVVAVSGDLEALVVMIMQPPTEVVVCDLLGVEAGTELGLSALGELGNILGASYLGGLATLTGLALESSPPEIFIDTLAAALTRAGLRGEETVILLESTLAVDGNAECSPMLLFAPGEQGADEILGRLGVSRET